MSISDGSAAVRRLRRTRAAFAAAVEASTAVANVRSMATRGDIAARDARSVALLAGSGDALGRWIRGSGPYGWLTAEPESGVIVIDLGETATVGPVLAAASRVAEWTGSRWRGSAPDRLLTRLTGGCANAPVRAVGWAVVAVLVGVLAISTVRGDVPAGRYLVALGLALLATRDRRSAAELRGSPVGRALSALLVPPEPDEADGGQDERRRA